MKAKHLLTGQQYQMILTALSTERRDAIRGWLPTAIAKDQRNATFWAKRIESINDTAEAVLEAAVDYEMRASQLKQESTSK